MYDGGIRSVTGENATAHIFASYPRQGLSHINGYFDVVGIAFHLSDVEICQKTRTQKY